MKRVLRRGFTLIELMICIVIISLLAGIVFPHFVMVRSRARYVACISNIKNISTALESYFADKKVYPTVAEFKGTDFQGSSSYIHTPKCPSTKLDYEYIPSSDNGVSPTGYILACQKGENAHVIVNHADGYPQFTSNGHLIEKPD